LTTIFPNFALPKSTYQPALSYQQKAKWDRFDIDKYLSDIPAKKYGIDEVAYIYSKTSPRLFDQFVAEITSKSGSNDPIKLLEFQKECIAIGEFIKTFPTSLESYYINGEIIKQNLALSPLEQP
jgi:hypothetical protein